MGIFVKSNYIVNTGTIAQVFQCTAKVILLAKMNELWTFYHGFYGSTSCCISQGPSQWERAIFDPPQLRDPATDFHET